MKEKIIEILEGYGFSPRQTTKCAEELLGLFSVINWVAYDFMNIESRPRKYGKYLVVRKDGKIHWETWNGSGWAYNEKVIRYWAVIQPPCL